ncbi:methyltransferase domain-containing protein [Sphingomonas sp. Leaf33]|uniref:methyltransferase domain-containing protein n=1 Tax=Sphingomonas sp. Leaf33 TaxID=1736215 RepID=UPI000A613D5B|nr:methyltransferase domain-containing protein [Sphingomonas sp. Leaf33]
MSEDIPPFAFDAAFYTRTNTDLAGFTPEEAAEHFANFGIAEGRQGHPFGSRQAFTERLASYASVLEIGPFCKPTARGPNVRYLDVLDETELRERASALGADADACPAKIDYLGDIHDIDDAFAAVVSSHCIEHQPDLIHHLDGVARVLSPGGRYFLYVPDKRYCFDHFMAESTIADVIQAHRERRTVHTLRSVIEHHALNTHNDPATHWAGRHDTGHGAAFADRVKLAIEMHDTADGYLDVHAWYFTPHSFAGLMTALYDIGLSRLRLTEIYPTRRDDAEFYAVLERV